MIRKHKQVIATLNIMCPTDNSCPRTRRKKIDGAALAADNSLSLVPQMLLKGDVDTAVGVMNQAIIKASVCPKQKKRKNRPWYDNECRSLKNAVMGQQPGTQEFASARRKYLNLITQKRQQYNENKLLQRVEESELRPWALLRKSGRPPLDGAIGTEELRSHFVPLLSSGSSLAPITELVAPADWHDAPFSLDEVRDAMLRCPNNKAPG